LKKKLTCGHAVVLSVIKVVLFLYM